MEKLLLFDGNSIINRAFYALPILTSKDGFYTNAVYGFMNIFYKIVDEETPDYICVAFDLPAPTFRHEKFSEYKGTRKRMPDELRPQIPLLKELLHALNIRTCESEGIEADDILGTLAKKAEAKGIGAVVVSGDRDLLQIASDNIKIRIPKTKAGKTEIEDYYAKDVLDYYGVTPEQFIDVKALMGDASDNIPGVSGIGEKTAVKIIAEHGSLKNALDNPEKVMPKKAGEKLALEKDNAVLSKLLATIITDADIELDLTKYDSDISAEGYEFFERLGFKTLLNRFKKAEIEKKGNNALEAITVDDLDGFIQKLAAQKMAAYCIFTHNGEINALSFAFDDSSAYYVEIPSPLHEEITLRKLKPFFENEKINKITGDAKKSFKLLSGCGIKVNNVIFDVFLAAYVIDPTKKAYSHDTLAYDFLNETMESEEEALGKGKSKISVLSLEAKKRAEYCAANASIFYRLYNTMNKKLEEAEQTELYYQIENKLMYVLFDMEQSGIKVDREALIKYGEMLDVKISTLTAMIYEMSGEEFNINSPKQLGEVLFEHLGLKSMKKTKTGYSTGIEELERLKFEHPVISHIIEYRTYSKLKSTYVDGLLSVMNPETDKLHTTFNQTVAATGRLSSTDPNLQNIPVRLELGRELRKVFIPDNDEYIFIDGDYSQIELRVLAHISADEKLIEAFKSGMDIHRLTASQVNDMPYELITPGQRNAAKAVNFGIIYGISAFSLSVDLGITKKEAEKYINAYFNAYPKIKEYLDKSIDDAKKTGVAKTMWGRKRPMPELASSNFNMRSFGERVAMNMPIQGTAADIIKIAMIKVYDALLDSNLKSKMLLQVHDELLVMAHKTEIHDVSKLLKAEMESAVQMLVPLVADIHEGETWFDAK